MNTTTAAPSTGTRTQKIEPLSESVVAVYKNHADAEEAVRKLEHAGIPLRKISIIGRNFELREDPQGYYRPSDAAKEGAGFGAWFGGLFGMLLGFGFFVFPVAGTLVVLGPLAGLIAGAISGAGIGALVSALISLGIPKDQAIKYEARLKAGEFLITVMGSPEEAEQAENLLRGTGEVEVQTFHTDQKAA